MQTSTPVDLLRLPEKDALVKEFVGKSLEQLRTPAFVIDRAVFARNCAKMHTNAQGWGARFRAHLKTHKTVEGTRLQLVSTADKTDAVVVSTMMEAWKVYSEGLVADGTVKDILYGLPVAINKIADLSNLWDAIGPQGAILRVFIDNVKQVEALEAFEKQRTNPRRWSAFIKVDGGQNRAGLYPGSSAFDGLIKSLAASPAISVYGFYCHAGNSYASTSLSQASSFLSSEVEAVNEAAQFATPILQQSPSDDDAKPARFVLSVGSTPTAHSASAETRARLSSLLFGDLELHAGNYPMLDLQQLHTGLVGRDRIAQRVLATIISYYPGRGEDGADEALCDAGGIAMSKDTGPSGGYGDVIGKPWRLRMISQEHGILGRLKSSDTTGSQDQGEANLEIGSMVEIVGQHACLTAAAYPWYYVVDSGIPGEAGQKVVDVWVPWKGW